MISDPRYNDTEAAATWGAEKSAERASREREFGVEQAVSHIIGDMPFLVLPVEDEPGLKSLRGFIERNSIALLSNFAKDTLDPASVGWLGHSCNRERVKLSGLWNQNHVDHSYNTDFLAVLKGLVSKVEATA